MSDLSIEYSLNTPTFFNSNANILNKKIFDLARNNSISGGGMGGGMGGGGMGGGMGGMGGGMGWKGVGGFGFSVNISDFITLLIGIIIIIIGFVLLGFKNDLIEVQAIIEAQSCDKSQAQAQAQSQECDINIRYIVDDTQYSKIISINKNNIPSTQTFRIYYHRSNPNSIQLFNPNYYAIGLGMIIIGIIIMLFFTSSSSSTDEKTDELRLIKTGTDLYSSALNKDGLNIVYSD